MPWPKEPIPDTDKLYRWVLAENIRQDGFPRPAAFKDNKGGMSTDWDNYSTPEETRSRGLPPVENLGVLRLIAGEVRQIDSLVVEHTPKDDNRAHTDVFGDKTDPEVRLKLARSSKWLILPEGYTASET